jgi:hypothetical protein
MKRSNPYAVSALSIGIALVFAAGCGRESVTEVDEDIPRDLPTAVIGVPQAPHAQVWACPTLRHWEGRARNKGKSKGCEILESGTTVKLLDKDVPSPSGGIAGFALIEYETTAGETKRGYVSRIGVQIAEPPPQPR